MTSFLAATLAALLTHGAPPPSPAPGLVFVEGGKTQVGSPIEEALELGRENPGQFSLLAAETPQHELRVESFFLMTTEVTQEQYAAYIRATATLPPSSWGQEVIAAAAEAFAVEEEQRLAAARARGEAALPEGFNRDAWWRANGRSTSWSVPEGTHTLPVAWVTLEDAQAFARWAGLRLPTEFEFQRAGRGASRDRYPWGNDWQRGERCSSSAQRTSRPSPVGSFPAGATRSGIQDLAGNVWEWTSSRFVAYPGYKELQFKAPENGRANIIDSIARWDRERFVLVGGSFQNGRLEARLALRRPTDPTQSTDAIGFRCALSPEPGLDLARALVERDAARSAWGKLTFAPERALVVDRWQGEPGQATRERRNPDGSVVREPLPGYAVISAYDYVAFVPVVEHPWSSLRALKAASLSPAPIPFGLLALSKPCASPALPARTYLLSYRAAGPIGASTPKLPETFDATIDGWIFSAPDGTPLVQSPCTKLEYGRVAGRGVRLNAPSSSPERECALLMGFAGVRIENNGYNFELPLEFATGTIGAGWRTNQR